ncbi:DUF2285 domain-containing protein, partial [Bradyrhizobium sp. IC4060]|uniref:DUF2285 domain-containing protein n=1 Tax=Bradyrhizobium sp. IC4060 TaxID=2793807 RepID=UPI001CD333F8
ASSVAVDLPLDRNFEVRLRAAHRLSLALERRPLGPPALALPILTRHRLILAFHAVDGSLKENGYREIRKVYSISIVLPIAAERTNHLRSRTIRLVHTGLRLMRGGYRALLRR